MNDARRVLLKSQQDPAWFARHVLGVHWWSKQREIAESVRDNRRTSVRSANGVGKTFTAAGVTLWYLASFPGSQVVTTANTWNQVRDVLWREIYRQYRGARFPIGGEIQQTRLELPDGRFAVGLSSPPENRESFQGFHADRLLIVVDEASGLHPAIMDAIEGSMTGQDARLLMIGNPTQLSGPFFDSHTNTRGVYSTLAVSAYDTPVFTGERCPPAVTAHLPSEVSMEEKRMMYGEGSVAWDVRVLGQFPTTSDDTVVSLADVEAAQQRDLPPDPEHDAGQVACDVARFGSDETVIASRVGNRIRIERVLHKRATTEVAGAILDVARNLRCDGFPELTVDDDGVGGGVTDILRDQGYRVHAFRAGSSAHQSSMYPNARSEGWFTLSQQMPGLDLDADAQLAADLTAPRYQLDPAGRRRVEKKDETKKRLGNRSPDRADAVFMLVAPKSATPVEGLNVWT